MFEVDTEDIDAVREGGRGGADELDANERTLGGRDVLGVRVRATYGNGPGGGGGGTLRDPLPVLDPVVFGDAR